MGNQFDKANDYLNVGSWVGVDHVELRICSGGSSWVNVGHIVARGW